MEFEILKLSEIAEIISGQSPPSSTYNNSGNGIPFFQGKADFGKKHPKVRYWCTKPTKISVPNDILMSVRAPVGPVIINNVKACIGRGIGIIRVNQNVSLDYIYYYLKINEEKIASLGVGSTFKAISQKDLKQLEILIPKNFSDQIRIAEILTQAENLITQRKESIALLDELLKSSFLEMFGDPVRNEKGWELLNISKLIKTTINESPVKFPKKVYDYIDIASINNKSKIIEGVNNVLGSEAPSRARQLVELNDILVSTVRPNLNAVTLIRNQFNNPIASTGFCILRSTDSINHEYLFMLTKSNYFINELLKKIKGANYPAVSDKDIKNVIIPLPPIKLQNQFATLVEKVEALKSEYQASLKELENMYGVLSQKAFKGELRVEENINN